MIQGPGKRGFTLIELLAVIAVIGILIALLLPAIQAAREAARRDVCINRLKQIGLSVHSVEGSYKRLPANQWSEAGGPWDMGGGFGWSWLTYLLPYMEEMTLFDRLDIRHNAPDVADAMLARPNGYVCPSYGGPSYQDPVAGLGGISNYKAMGATTDQSLMFFNPQAGGVPPYTPATQHPDGVIFPGMRLRFADIADGVDMTVVATETIEEVHAVWQFGNTATLVGFPDQVNQALQAPVIGGHDYWHFEHFQTGQYEDDSQVDLSVVRTYLNWDYEGVDGPYQSNVSPQHQPTRGPGAQHPGVVNHLFVDGHVASLSTEIDPSIYWFIITRNGGDPASEFFGVY